MREERKWAFRKMGPAERDHKGVQNKFIQQINDVVYWIAPIPWCELAGLTWEAYLDEEYGEDSA